MLANLQSLKFAAQYGLDSWMHDDRTDIYVFSKGTKSFEKREGYSFSVFALSDECRGVSISGTKYLLENAAVTNSFPIGVSNEWKEETAEVSLESGILMVVLSKL